MLGSAMFTRSFVCLGSALLAPQLQTGFGKNNIFGSMLKHARTAPCAIWNSEEKSFLGGKFHGTKYVLKRFDMGASKYVASFIDLRQHKRTKICHVGVLPSLSLPGLGFPPFGLFNVFAFICKAPCAVDLHGRSPE